MRLVVEAIAAILFMLSTGLLFNEAVRARHILFTLVGIVALASSYVIIKGVLDATVGHRMHHAHAASVAAPAPAPSVADIPTSDSVLETVYAATESALNRVVRAGTKQTTASVGSDTVVDVIVGLSLAALGLLSQLLSSLFRRLTGG